VTERLLDLKIDDAGVTAFTAVVQFGAVIAVLLYFRADIVRLVVAGVRAVRDPAARTGPDARLAAFVIIGSIPIGVVGLATKSLVEGPLRNLGVIAAALILWSAVLVYAERRHAAQRVTHGEKGLTLPDAVVMGLVQCVALVPRVSRAGATISAGLLRGLDRVAATRLAFLLAIPALTAATLLELRKAVGGGVGVAPTLLGTAVAFVVAYASIAWLLRFVAGHPISAFVPYRIVAGITIAVLLAVGTL